MSRRHSSAPRDSRPIRPLKVGEAMRHVLADILARGELADPALADAIVSVSEVRVTPDLRQATAFVQTLGGDAAAQARVCAALNRQARTLKAQVAQRVNTKYAAELEFRVDESFAEAAHIDELLRRPEVARDLAPDAGGPDAGGPTTDDAGS